MPLIQNLCTAIVDSTESPPFTPVALTLDANVADVKWTSTFP
ncbi:hypothetical protein LINPERHAP2_LOCUS19800 [Linum perenne]